jgi:hypothetical protein
MVEEEEFESQAFWCWMGSQEPEAHEAIGPETAAREYAVSQAAPGLQRMTALDSPDKMGLLVNVARRDGSSLQQVTVTLSLESRMVHNA